MSVYVDMPRYRVGRMRMCHMMADTCVELTAMAERIGVARRHLQFPSDPKEHFDVCRRARADAIRYGAIEVSSRDLIAIIRRRRARIAEQATGGSARG